MKNLKLTLLALVISTFAHAQISTPRPSPEGSVYSKVGLTDITIDYFRPKVKGRKIFGAGDEYLEKYGQLWRTGANSGSVLTLSSAAKIGSTDVKEGKYLILTIPGADEWTFILYGDLEIGGNMSAFKKENEVMRTTVKPSKLAKPVETLTFNISDISEDNTSANIQFAWSDVSFKVPVKVSFEDQVIAEIIEKTKADKVDPATYIQAANFYFAYDKDLNQALGWVNKYLAMEENNKQFWNVHLQAKILAKLGKKKEAIEAAQKSISLAKESPDGDFGYIKRNENLIADLK